MRSPNGSKRTPDPLEAEVAAEKAAALGHAGRQMEKALAELRASAAPPGSDERERLLDEAADRVWHYLIQRELIGLREQSGAIADYGIPREVMNRVGAVRKAPGR